MPIIYLKTNKIQIIVNFFLLLFCGILNLKSRNTVFLFVFPII